jgi:ribosomal protein L11 methyltransferase
MATLSWHAFSVTVETPAAEAVEFAFNELNALGTEINHLFQKQTETVTVTGYFHRQFDALGGITDALEIYGFPPEMVRSTEWKTIEETDWLAEWKKHWKPTAVGEFIVAPPWETVDKPGSIVISIEPNMAFGTGTHDTTQLCLAAIQDNFTPGETFMDVGTGTGILAIAAAKLNSRMNDAWLPNHEHTPPIFAVDTDEKSVEIAVENASLNGVADQILFSSGSVTAETPAFDFTCANLTADVILPILPLLLEKTRRVLLLSGILKEQESSVTAQLEKLGITGPAVAQSGEWISIVSQLEA